MLIFFIILLVLACLGILCEYSSETNKLKSNLLESEEKYRSLESKVPLLIESALQKVKIEFDREYRDLENRYNLLNNSIPITIKEERAKAVETSRVVLKGKISEEIVPLLPNFPFTISDCRFSGMPVDFIIYKGISKNNIEEIIFLDVKTGGAALSSSQRQIKKVIEEGKVSWVTYNR